MLRDLKDKEEQLHQVRAQARRPGGTLGKQRGPVAGVLRRRAMLWERRGGRWLVARPDGALEARARHLDFILR